MNRGGASRVSPSGRINASTDGDAQGAHHGSPGARREGYFAQCFNTAVPQLDDSSFERFQLDPLCCPDDLLCSEDEVTDLLLNLDTTKANGPDGISAIMLKSTAYSIAPGLTKFFNKCISSGRLPSTWKLSSVVPIPKGDDGSSVTNY